MRILPPSPKRRYIIIVLLIALIIFAWTYLLNKDAFQRKAKPGWYVSLPVYDGVILGDSGLAGKTSKSWIWTYDLASRKFDLKASIPGYVDIIEGSSPEMIAWRYPQSGFDWKRPWRGHRYRNEHYLLREENAQAEYLEALTTDVSMTLAHLKLWLFNKDIDVGLTRWLIPGTDTFLQTFVSHVTHNADLRIYPSGGIRYSSLPGVWNCCISPAVGPGKSMALLVSNDWQNDIAWITLCRIRYAESLDHAVIKGYVDDIYAWGENEVVLLGKSPGDEKTPFCTWLVRFNTEPFPSIVSVEVEEQPFEESWNTRYWHDGIEYCYTQDPPGINVRENPFLKKYRAQKTVQPFYVANQTGDPKAFDSTFRVWEIDYPSVKPVLDGQVLYDEKTDTIRLETHDLPIQTPPQ